MSIGRDSGVTLGLWMIIGGKLVVNLRLVLYLVLGLVLVLDIGIGVRMDADGVDEDICYVFPSHFFITIYIF